MSVSRFHAILTGSDIDSRMACVGIMLGFEVIVRVSQCTAAESKRGPLREIVTADLHSRRHQRQTGEGSGR